MSRRRRHGYAGVVVVSRVVKLLVSLAVAAGDGVVGPARRLLRRSDQPQVAVLYYHEVRPESRARFSWQLDQLTRLARPIPVELRAPPTPGARYAAITFDDAYVSVLENAVPELVRRGIPFAVFVPSGNLGDRPRWIIDPSHPCHDEQVMTGDQLKALACNGLATIGSHTVVHPNLLLLPDDQSDAEIAGSKQDLEAIMGRPVELLAFPHGAYDDRHLAMAQRSGYRRVFSILPDSRRLFSDDFVVGRIHSEPEDWRIETLLKLRCAYRWLPYAFTTKRRLKDLLRRGT